MEKETQLPAQRQIMTPDEIKVIQLSLTGTIEDLEHEMKMPQAAQYKKEARESMADILRTAKSALLKVAGASGHLIRFAPLKPGEEKEFLI
jgi:hypothetical protein